MQEHTTGQRRAWRTRATASVLGCISWLGLLGAPGANPAAAADFEIGELRGHVDTTLSAGASMRVSGRDCRLVHVTNGGCTEDQEFLNSDDGNLNYDNYDVFANTYKATVDLELDWRNYGAFVRGTGFYDAITMNVDTQRTPLSRDALYTSSAFSGGVVGMGYRLLDAYAYGNFELAGRPLDIRLGNQVLSWGENLFYAGGVNAINAIDLPRFRTPGSELREALLPAPMVRVSAELFRNFSIEGFYQVYWNRTELDPAGSYYSDATFGQDVVGRGAEATYVLYDPGIDDAALTRVARELANPEPVEISFSLADDCDSPRPPEAEEFRPNLPGATAQNLPRTTEEMVEATYSPVAPIVAPVVPPLDPGDPPVIDPGELAFFEFLINRIIAFGGDPKVVTVTPPILPFAIPRLHDVTPPKTGQWGAALRYFAEAMRTEFGAYFLRIHAKQPSVGWEAEPLALAVQPFAAGGLEILLDQFAAIGQEGLDIPTCIECIGVPSGYFREYPKDINIFGVSAATELFGIAWGAEVSYHDRLPVPIDGEIVLRDLIDEVSQTGRRTRRSGFVREEKIQAQLNAIATIGPGDPYIGALVRGLQVSSLALAAEAAVVSFPNLDDDVVYQPPPGRTGVDDLSWGYSMRLQGFYDNPFGVPVTLVPRVSFSHDVHGDTPGRYPFIEGRKSISAGVNVDYLGVWQFDFSYNNPFGGSVANGIRDRDWISLSVTRSF